jgi:antitoxin component YwqK of YwqJK toxin-antitoxin module
MIHIIMATLQQKQEIVKNISNEDIVVEYTVNEKDEKEGKETKTVKGTLIMESHYKNGQLDGTQTLFCDGKPGIITTYVAGKEHGESIMYGKDGQISTKSMFNMGDTVKTQIMTKEGKVVTENEQKLIESRGLFGQQIKWPVSHGKFVMYSTTDPDRKSMEMMYDNGKQHGPSLVYHSNGTIALSENYSHGKLDGRVTGTYQNGDSQFEADYSDGKLTKLYYYTDKQGRDCKLGNGEIVVYKCFIRLFESVMVTLVVPATSKRVTTLVTGEKHPLWDCEFDIYPRIESAYVKSIITESGKKLSSWTPDETYYRKGLEPTLYTVGKMVHSPSFNDDMSNPQGAGITVKRYPENWRWWQPKESKCIIL